MSSDNTEAERSPSNRGQERRGSVRPSRGNDGRRSGDISPRVSFTKKFLVIVIAAVNAVYLVSEALLASLNAC